MLLISVVNAQQGVYVSRNAVLSFYSQAPIEDIKAESRSAYSSLNVNTKEIYFKVEMRTFKFAKGKMQEHFNENYMESDKYPNSEFKGKINEDVDLSKDGDYPVTVQGDLTIHNVTKNYTTKGMLKVTSGKIKGDATFKVKLADHQIQIPTLVIKNIAEIVDVTVSVSYD